MISLFNIDPIVRDILADMPLKEKAIIANLDQDIDKLSFHFTKLFRSFFHDIDHHSSW